MYFEPTGAALGARVCGVDLSTALSEDQGEALRHGFARYQVLCFPDQHLDPEDLLRFAGYFGKVARYPYAADLPGYPGITEVIKKADDTVNFGGVWHSDTSYTSDPPAASLLYSRTVPDQGGDTLFSDMYAAWDALSPGLRAFLESINAVNTSALRSASGSNLRHRFKHSMAIKYTDRDDLAAIHPVARKHPETGRYALYINSAHTRQFAGMSEAESAPLLKFLFQHLKEPHFTYRHRWQPDMLTVWDNRCTQHYAVNDYHGMRRVMQRVTISA